MLGILRTCVGDNSLQRVLCVSLLGQGLLLLWAHTVLGSFAYPWAVPSVSSSSPTARKGLFKHLVHLSLLWGPPWCVVALIIGLYLFSFPVKTE